MTNAHPLRPGPRRTLNEQAILDAALALLAELGAERVTIRGIAARVGIAPNAVYTYFPDKAAVLAGLAEQLLGRVRDEQDGDSSLPWRDRVHALRVHRPCRRRLVPGEAQRPEPGRLRRIGRRGPPADPPAAVGAAASCRYSGRLSVSAPAGSGGCRRTRSP